MSSDLMQRVLLGFRVTVDGTGAQPDARSGAGVWAARTAAGDAAYLKVTPASQGPLSAARRELRFYRELARTAPVRTPPLLDDFDDEAGVALLLAAAGEPRSPASWTAAMWTELGTGLAALHNMPLPPGADWGRSDAAIEAAPGVEAFWAGRLAQLSDVVADSTRLLDAMAALSPVFIHGDCHTGNMLHDADGLIFCDWQSAGIGSPAADLAFLSVRATPSGAVVPPALLDAYLLGRACDRDLLQRALLAEELTTFVFRWPPYATYNTRSGIARVVRRTRELASRWLAGAGPGDGRSTSGHTG